jgi:hypothetical protein
MSNRIFSEEKVKDIIAKVEIDVKIMSAEHYLKFIEMTTNPIKERFDFLTEENRMQDEEWVELLGQLNAFGIIEKELTNTLNGLIERKKTF